MQENQQNNTNKAPVNAYLIGALALVSVVGGVIFYNKQATAPQINIQETTPQATIEPLPETQPVTSIAPSTIPTPEPEEASVITTEPLPQATVPTPEPAPPLPSLDNSDMLVTQKAKELSWLPSLSEHLISKDLVRNFVTFADNLSRGDLAAKYSPLAKPVQKFSVNEINQEMYIDPVSYKRYDVYVDMFNSLNADMAMEHLQQLMPLLDEAYMELGYEQGTFITTLENALEEMLSAPVIRNPIKVVAPSAMYKYADPQLESLSEVQKLMLRMGPDNITKLRPKLQQLQISLAQLNNN